MKFIKQIDRGGFGRVDKVRLANGQRAARKTFDPVFANLSEDDRNKQRRRFIREVRIQSSFLSESFFPVIRSDLSGDNPWFAMPLAERNFAREIEDCHANGGIPQIALADILNALEELHDLGYVHRDLKPQNILLLNDRWRLTDFGLTLPPSGTTTRLTSYESSWGTPMYCAPEQATEFRNATAAVDIYAFGCILHDIFGNAPRVPYQRQSADGQIGMIIEKCTDLRPDRRFKSIRALRGALLTQLAAGPSISGSQSANEWAEALRDSEIWSEARLGEFAAYLRRVQGTGDLHLIFAEIDEDILSEFKDLDADLWKTVALAYCDWVQSTSFVFAYCDAIVRRLEAIFYDGDLDLKAACALAAAALGHSHHRFYVMGRVVQMCGHDLSENTATRIAIEIRAAEVEEDFKICAGVIDHEYSDYHPAIADALAVDGENAS